MEMKLPSQERLFFGGLAGYRYTFIKDEGLPMHKHTEENVHILIVTKGSIKVYGPDLPETIHYPGDIVDFIEDQEHEVIALEDNTELISILKWTRNERHISISYSPSL